MSLSSRISKRPVRFSKAGWWFLLATVLTGIAAYHSANNVLFLGLSFLLSGLLLNGLISWWNFSRLQFTNLRASQSRVGEESEIVVDMLDAKTILPSYGLIAVVELIPPSGEVRWMRCFVRRRGGERHVRIAFNWCPEYRGMHQIRLVGVESTFPFGFILKTYPLRIEMKALVWPMKVEVSGEEGYASAHPKGIAVSKRSVGSTMDEIEGLRDYRRGDPLRQIHWRKTAQSPVPIVKIGRSEQGRSQYCLAFDFEKAHFPLGSELDLFCGYVGSLAEQYLEAGKDLEVVLHNGDPLMVAGDAGWIRLMDELAVIEPFNRSIESDRLRRLGFRIVSPSEVMAKLRMIHSKGPDAGLVKAEITKAKGQRS